MHLEEAACSMANKPSNLRLLQHRADGGCELLSALWGLLGAVVQTDNVVVYVCRDLPQLKQECQAVLQSKQVTLERGRLVAPLVVADAGCMPFEPALMVSQHTCCNPCALTCSAFLELFVVTWRHEQHQPCAVRLPGGRLMCYCNCPWLIFPVVAASTAVHTPPHPAAGVVGQCTQAAGC